MGTVALMGAGRFAGGGGGVAGPTVVYEDNTFTASALTTYTFTSRAIGTAALDRYIIVGVFGYASTRTVSTLTVGGISASLVKRSQQGTVTAELWIAAVPTGTTANVVVTWSGGQSTGCGIGIWSATGLASATPVDTDGGNVNVPSASVTLDSTPGGFAVGIGEHSNTTAGSITWTGISERFDVNWTATARYSGADGATASTTITITCGVGATGNSQSPFAVATFA